MNHRITVGLLVLLAGCVSTTPRWDSTFGQSARAALESQQLNPTAGRNRNPASGIDAQAARAAIQRYEQSASAPPGAAPVMPSGVK